MMPFLVRSRNRENMIASRIDPRFLMNNQHGTRRRVSSPSNQMSAGRHNIDAPLAETLTFLSLVMAQQALVLQSVYTKL